MQSETKGTADINGFLDTIARSGLLPRSEAEAILNELPADQRDNAQALADALVRRGKLSTFQAKKLLKGAYFGLVLGPYEIVAPIGKGGMGTVFLARDVRMQKLVALKVLPPKKARKNRRMLERFQRELEINRRVAHPHIAWTYDGGEIHGVFYIAMEFIPGKTLARIVSEQGPFQVNELARIAVEVALGLHHAHSMGVIHRDMKPSNIMITPNGHAKVLDLGLALIEGEMSGEREVVGGRGYVVGSMDYIAPEQIKDAAAVGPAADIYSLGCTLYAALTGRPPFPGGDAFDKMRRHRKEQPTDLRQLRPDIPEGFAKIIEKMMAKKPQHRYASMKEVREALLPWAVGAVGMASSESVDTALENIVHALQTQDVDSEMGDITILGTTEGSQVDSPAPLPVPSGQRKWIVVSPRSVWLISAVVAFWLLVLIGIGLFFVFGY